MLLEKNARGLKNLKGFLSGQKEHSKKIWSFNSIFLSTIFFKLISTFPIIVFFRQDEAVLPPDDNDFLITE